jgi:YbbR domain-containing protein
VIVRGDQAFIDDVFSIATQPVNLDGAQGDIVRSVQLDLPQGVEVPGGRRLVTVTISIEPATGEFTFQVPVTTRNLGAGLSIAGALPVVQVTLIGPQPVLAGVSAADISAVVDLNELGAGAHTVTVTIAALAGVTTATATPPSVSLVLEQG